MTQILSKSLQDINAFFLSWKRTSHYRIWKYHKNLKIKTFAQVV